MILRVQLRNGDSRTGRYVCHDDMHLWLNDGRERKIEQVMIADVIEAPTRNVEFPIECLEGE